jgi:hypothetical protein
VYPPVRAPGHLRLDQLGGIGRHLRRQPADFLCLRLQYAELLAPKGRLQLRDVGEAPARLMAKSKLASTLRPTMSTILRLNAAAPWPAPSKDLSNAVKDASKAFKE